MPPPAGVASPVYWGNEARLRDLFPHVAGLRVQRRDFVFRYESFQHFIDVFREYYGPMKRAFTTLDESGRAALLEDLRLLVERFRTSTLRNTLAIPAEYLEAIIER